MSLSHTKFLSRVFFYGLLAAFGSLFALAFLSLGFHNLESPWIFLLLAVGIEEIFKGVLTYRLPTHSSSSPLFRIWLTGALFGIGFLFVEILLLLDANQLQTHSLPLLIPVMIIHILTSIFWIAGWESFRNQKNAFLSYLFPFLAFFLHTIYNSIVFIGFFSLS
jgi:hypothetical protein